MRGVFATVKLPLMNLHPTLNSLESALRFRSARRVVQDVAYEMVQLAPQLARWDNTERDYNPNPNEMVVMDARFEGSSIAYPAVEFVQSQDGSEVVTFKAQRADGTTTTFTRQQDEHHARCARFEIVTSGKSSVVLLDSETGLLVNFEEHCLKV